MEPGTIALVAAGLKGLVGAIGGKQKANQADSIARAAYEKEKAAKDEQEKRRFDTINYLQAVMQARGTKVPQGAFDVLKARGPYSMPAYQKGYRPNAVASFFGGAADAYSDMLTSSLAGSQGTLPVPRPGAVAGGIDPNAWKTPRFSVPVSPWD